MNVLIVDDSKAMQNIITKSMKHLGYVDDQYSYAFDGKEALATIRAARPDLVLCDLHMPKMTGLELLQTLRSEHNPTKVIIVSIDDSENTVASVTNAGGDAFLKKPFTSEQLFTTVTRLIDKPLEQKTETKYSVRELMPEKLVLERILGSLAGTDVHLTEARFGDIDFDRSPYYGGTLQNEHSRVVLAMFLDALAANTIAAVIGRRPLDEALAAAQAKQIDTASKQLLLAFLGVLSGLCKASDSGQLLDIHAEHFAENAHTHLRQHLQQYADSMLVYDLECGGSKGGKVILLSP